MVQHKTCVAARSSLIIAGIIFAVLALVHLYRIFYFFPVILGATVVPASASVIALIVLGLLAVLMFWASTKA